MYDCMLVRILATPFIIKLPNLVSDISCDYLIRNSYFFVNISNVLETCVWCLTIVYDVMVTLALSVTQWHISKILHFSPLVSWLLSLVHKDIFQKYYIFRHLCYIIYIQGPPADTELPDDFPIIPFHPIERINRLSPPHRSNQLLVLPPAGLSDLCLIDTKLNIFLTL